MYSVGIAYLLWFLSGFGALGLHRFYLRKFPTGILWMFSFGLGFVGGIYDFFTLSRQVQEANMRRAIDESLNQNYERKARSNPFRTLDTENWRYAEDTKSRVVREKDSLERNILRRAKENKGILTVSEVALTADVSLEDAKKALDALVTRGFAELRVRKSGTLVYVLSEFRDENEDLEDF
jgi:TM2 domain-containing membrane protein YozV